MCHIPDAAKAAANRGINVRRELCMKCPFADQCGYLKQESELIERAEAHAGLVIFAVHDYAFLRLPGGIAPGLVVFDEAPARAVVHQSVKRGVLDVDLAFEGAKTPKGSMFADLGEEADALAALSDKIKPLMGHLRAALDYCQGKELDHLRHAGWDAAAMAGAIDALDAFADRSTDALFNIAHELQAQDAAFDLDGFMSKQLADKELKATAQLKELFEAIRVEIDGDLPNLVGVFQREGKIHSFRLKRPTFPDSTPLLHLDGTANHELAQAVLGISICIRSQPSGTQRLSSALAKASPTPRSRAQAVLTHGWRTPSAPAPSSKR